MCYALGNMLVLRHVELGLSQILLGRRHRCELLYAINGDRVIKLEIKATRLVVIAGNGVTPGCTLKIS